MERGGKLNVCRIYSRFYLWCSALEEQLFWAEQTVQGQAGNCSVNLRGIDPELASSDISDMTRGWDDTCQDHCHRHHHHRSTVFLENNSGLNDCKNKSKLCPSGATLMIINKHFKRAALMFKSVGTTAWAVNGQNNEYTNSFRPSDLEF